MRVSSLTDESPTFLSSLHPIQFIFTPQIRGDAFEPHPPTFCILYERSQRAHDSTRFLHVRGLRQQPVHDQSHILVQLSSGKGPGTAASMGGTVSDPALTARCSLTSIPFIFFNPRPPIYHIPLSPYRLIPLSPYPPSVHLRVSRSSIGTPEIPLSRRRQ